MPHCKLFIILPATFCSLLLSCHTTTKEEQLIYSQLNDQLEQSTKIIRESSLVYFRDLDAKTFDPSRAEKANTWLLKASEVQQLSSGIFTYLEDTKQSMPLHSGPVILDTLFKTIDSFLSEISAINPVMTRQFTSEINSLSTFRDSVTVLSPGTMSAANKSLLSALQNRLSILESQLIAYCDNMVGTVSDTWYVAIPLINQNATHLNSGEELEINVGMGYVNYPSYPKVYINGDSMGAADNGFFQYKVKVPEAAGQYSIPVKIEYYKDREKITLHKHVDYYIN